MSVLPDWLRHPAILALLGILAAAAFSLLAIGFSPHPSHDPKSPANFSKAEFRFDKATDIPREGWSKAGLPFHDFYEAPRSAAKKGHVLWARFRFEGTALPSGHVALFSDYTPERFIVFVNGEEVFRNFSDPSSQKFASFKPAFVPIPREAIKSGANEIALRLESDTPWTLGLGNTALGAEGLIRNKHDRAYALQFQAPQIINGILITLTLCFFLFWMKRRSEKGFFWLSLVGIIWSTRNLHYSASNPAIGATLMWELVSVSIFLLTIAFMCFALTELDVRNRKWWIGWTFVAGGALILFRQILFASGQSDFLAFVLLAPFTLSLSVIFVIATVRNPSVENLAMFVAMTIAILWSFHDMIFLGNMWQGAGFQLQPFASVVVYGAFAFSLGRRMLRSFSAAENLNAQLAASVAQIRVELSASETARRELQVAHAVEIERERLMREIHDGIGSSLVTALAVAKKQDQSGVAAQVLKRSITDLKIAIDSLEPSGGDVSLVLASFRQRAQTDLADAGIELRWNVDALPALEWLDAPNTLHVLRIFQEIVSNIVKHSRASSVAVSCRQHQRGDREGVLVQFADNGIGISEPAPPAAKGLANMTARAQALGGALDISQGSSARGTSVSLWLPFNRSVRKSVNEPDDVALRIARNSRDGNGRAHLEERLIVPHNPDAADAYVEACTLRAQRTTHSLEIATSKFRHVIELAPDFAPAYVGLADSWLAASDYGKMSDELAYGTASATVRIALELDPDLAAGHRALGLILYWWEHDRKAAGFHFRRAIELDARCPQSRMCYGAALSDNGEFEAARREFAAARSEAPDLSPLKSHCALLDWHLSGQETRPTQLEDLTKSEPDFTLHWHFLGLARLCLGDGQGYVDALRHCAVLREEDSLFEELARCERSLSEGANAGLMQDLARWAMEGLAGQPHAQTPMAALCASHCRDRVLLEAIFASAQDRHERWGSAIFRSHIAGIWNQADWIKDTLRSLSAENMEGFAHQHT